MHLCIVTPLLSIFFKTASTYLLQQDNIVLLLAQHISNHGVTLRTVFADVSDAPAKKKQREYKQCDLAFMYQIKKRKEKHINQHTTAPDQQFREKTRTLTASVFAMLTDQRMSRYDDECPIRWDDRNQLLLQHIKQHMTFSFVM